MSRVPLLNFEGGPKFSLLNFEGGFGVPLLNFRGGGGGSWVPLLNFEVGPGSRVPGLTFTPCHRNHSIDLLCKSLDWFLYDRDLRYERVKSVLSLLVCTCVCLSHKVKAALLLIYILLNFYDIKNKIDDIKNSILAGKALILN